MDNKNIFKTILYFLIVITVIIVSSLISNKIWGTRSEKIVIPDSLVIKDKMNIIEFGQANNFSNPVLKQIFNLQSKSDLERKILDYGTADQITSLVIKKLALISEGSSKNWKKIIIKFVGWFLFLLFIFLFLRNRKFSSLLRRTLQLISILIFGIILGSDPSPMGTVKDAVYLLGTAGTVFPPRMIAFITFLILVFLANKYICSWGCQAGMLQDFLFRLNRTDKNKSIMWKQIKLPFIFTNTIRTLIFILLVIFAFGWGIDIIEPIDFFKVYNPVHLGILGSIFVAIILLVSLFIYRPWCHMICPFGLVGWLIEKISLIKINVDYSTCIACRKCAAACPSTVMNAILLRNKKTIPDCFSCYTCRNVCPTGSIHFSAVKRIKPSSDHFNKK